MPQKLDDCVAKVKGEKGVDNPWAVCNASIGKETKEGADILEKKTREKSHSYSIKAEIVKAVIKEHVGDNKFRVKKKPDNRINANRQVPVFNPPITNRPVEPDVQKTTKGIGGQVGKIDSDSNTNNITTDLWKKILDSQLRRNVKEPRY